jgi:signal transduction histidine kinase/ActR/RegA family two-component response regulator
MPIVNGSGALELAARRMRDADSRERLQPRRLAADVRTMATMKAHVLPVKRLVALFVVLSVVPLALLTFLSVHLAKNAVDSEAKARLSAYAGQTVTAMQSGMSNLSSLLNSYAQRNALKNALADPSHPNRAEALRQLRELTHTQTSESTFVLLTTAGRVVASDPASAAGAGDNFRLRGWFARTIRTGKPLISPAYRSAGAGHPLLVAITAPVRDANGTTTGVLVEIANTGTLQTYVKYFASTLGVGLTITDQTGLVLASPSKPASASLGHDPLVSAALRGKSGVGRQSTAAGPAATAYAPIPGLGWAVTASLPDSSIFSHINSLRSTVYTVAGVLGLVLLAGLALLVRTLRQRQRAELQASTSRLALEQAHAQAEEAQRQAEQANNAKSVFLSRMSHELRTPLNAVLGFGQLLEMDDLSEEQDESVEQILKAGQHLLGLINEVLDISRIEAGALSLSLEPVALRETLDEALALIRPLADQQLISVTINRVDDNPHVYADRQRLKQVLLNLLSNAVKYNRTGGTVEVSVRDSDETIRLEITDSGEGIPDNKLAQLFRPFERLGADLKQIEGTGLGLVLSKGLIETMGGHIGAESSPTGSTFWIQLQPAQAPIETADSDLHELAAHQAASALPAATVLYIEDNLSNLKLIERILEERPEVNLISAMQGSLGLDLAQQHRPDLILLDLHLPDLQGDLVLAQLRSNPATRTTPVVVLSADATQGRIERLLAQGANDYLSKPIDVHRFLAVLETYIRQPVNI